MRPEALAARQHGAILRSQVLRLRMSEGAVKARVRSGRGIAREPGLFVVAGSPDTFEQRLFLAFLGAGSGAVLSHVTAATLYGLVADKARPHVTVPKGNHHVSGPLRIVHQARRLSRRDVAKIGDFPVTTPNRTLLDLACVLPVRKLEAVLDDALMRKLITVDGLLRYVDGRNNRGVKLLRRVLFDRRDGVPQEEMEREFSRLVRRFKLPKPKLQHRFGRNKRIDAAYPDRKIAIELDS